MVGRPARRPDRTTAVNSGRRRRRACAGNTSGGELLATLAPTTGEDRPARAGPHAQPEPVVLRPTAVVRLERALAHEVLPLHDIGGAHPPVGGCARGGERPWAAPRWPRKLVTADAQRPQTPASITEETRRPTAGHVPTAHGPPGRARCVRGAPKRRARAGSPIVAGLWMG